MKSKNIKELIDYLESIKEQCGDNMKVLVDGENIEDFEDTIFVDSTKNVIDFVSYGYTN